MGCVRPVIRSIVLAGRYQNGSRGDDEAGKVEAKLSSPPPLMDGVLSPLLANNVFDVAGAGVASCAQSFNDGNSKLSRLVSLGLAPAVPSTGALA